MLCFCYSKLYHSVWQSLGPSIFCSLFLLLSVSVLFPLFLSFSTWGKTNPLLGHNLWASCTTTPALLLPLWTYPCLSLLPQCLLSASWFDQVCSCSRDSAHWPLPAWKFLPPMATWFIPSSSGVFEYHREDFSRLLRTPIKAFCLHPLPKALCLLPLLHLRPECLFPWGHCLSLPLRLWRAAGERELCCVLPHPQDWRGPSIR